MNGSLDNEAANNKSPSRFTRFLAMPGRQKRVLMMAALVIPLFRLALGTLGYARLCRMIDRPVAGPEPQMGERELAVFASCVNQATTVTIGTDNCLTRSLVLKWMLMRRGMATDLRIGVRTDRGTLSAHAWVEKNGKPINDRSDIGDDFAVFDQPVPLSSFD